MSESVIFENDHAGPTRQLSTSEKQRVIPEDWKENCQEKSRSSKNVHFLILPTYVRYNNQTPLAPFRGSKKEKKLDLLHFPLGYSHVISSLRQYTNHKIEVLDPYVEYVSIDEISSWLKKVYNQRQLENPDYLLLGGMSTSWPNIKKLTAIARKNFPSAKIICGGTVANLHHDLLLKSLGIDIAVLGEAELIIADLFRNLDDIYSVGGIAYLNKIGEVVKNSSPASPDLNVLPEPAWDLFNTNKYIESGKRQVGFRGLPINTSMGCPFSCHFCYVPGGQSMRYLSPDIIVDRIQKMKYQFDLDYVAFYDDILFVHKDWMWELGEKLIDSNVNILWNCSSRVNLFSEKDAPLLRLLRKAGLVRISFGIESGSPRILKEMGKTGVSPDKAKLALRLVRESGIRATANMILGYPGETAETIWESVEFCKENLLHPSFYLLQPFPGTEVYESYVRSKYNEEEYLNLIADYREGEKLPINLTTIPDDELLRLKDEAEAEIKKFHLSYYIRYHRINFLQQACKDIYQEAGRLVKGSLFKTP
jgi:anaerobic magnesium-protoporphyrin IX monomethyl ester cyclase